MKPQTKPAYNKATYKWQKYGSLVFGTSPVNTSGAYEGTIKQSAKDWYLFVNGSSPIYPKLLAAGYNEKQITDQGLGFDSLADTRAFLNWMSPNQEPVWIKNVILIDQSKTYLVFRPSPINKANYWKAEHAVKASGEAKDSHGFTIKPCSQGKTKEEAVEALKQIAYLKKASDTTWVSAFKGRSSNKVFDIE